MHQAYNNMDFLERLKNESRTQTILQEGFSDVVRGNSVWDDREGCEGVSFCPPDEYEDYCVSGGGLAEITGDESDYSKNKGVVDDIPLIMHKDDRLLITEASLKDDYEIRMPPSSSSATVRNNVLNIGSAFQGNVIPRTFTVGTNVDVRSSSLNPMSGTNKERSRSNRCTNHKENDAEAVRFLIKSSTVKLCDGYAWLKYGQKKIKHKIYPRCYFRCAYPNCGVIKQREASSNTEGLVSIIYIGKHNHLPPDKGTLNTRRKKVTLNV
ncbi:hypothetical protein KP509_13G048400 [Ceratopteris richardii]|uniref:WRKY domain-containing protein n=1 Tax=Ceratopteris richardii TaxID=49495 RepID=A0A8T2TFJ7_CERRI|nr:hypothetical protein KP509_13G048400 [Ceratopteris richardii]